ncbi:MAG: Ig-like domain repeat protein [Thermoguttaceae bacterium]
MSFGPKAATGFSVNSVTGQVTATSPGGTGTVDVQVTTLDGTSPASAADKFTYAAATTTTQVVSSASPSVYGQGVTFTATVSPVSPGAGTPTGTVSFYNGSAIAADLLDTETLSGGTATSVPTFSLAMGSHTITAVYSGDANYAGSTGTTPQTVNQANTSVQLTSSASLSVFCQAVTFTATVSPVSPGTGTPTGTVSFYDGSAIAAHLLDVETLSGGTATSIPISTLPVGAHTITAVYSGDAKYATSTATTPQTVNQANTSVQLASSADPSTAGQSVTFTATVSPVSPGAGTPDGTVFFYDGSAIAADLLDTETLNGGTATSIPISTLAVGAHTITAVYSGDANHATSTATTPQTVNQAIAPATTTAVASSVSPSMYGQGVAFTVAVSPVSAGGATPTGTVCFYDGDVSPADLLDTETLSWGTATSVPTFSLTVGSHTITAVYSGDANYAGSTGTTPQMVNPASTSVQLASSANPSTAGQALTFTATVSPAFTEMAGETVEFYDNYGASNQADLGPGTLNGKGQASLSVATLSVGTHSVTASYVGDVNYAGSTSTPLGEVVNAPGPATTTRLTSSTNPAAAGTKLILTATVTAASGTPTGSVEFYDYYGTSHQADLGPGKAGAHGVWTLNTSSLGIGIHSITASYGGGAKYAGSTSPPLFERINWKVRPMLLPVSTTTTLTTSPDGSAVGTPVTLTATVTTNSGSSSGMQNDTVEFDDNGTPFDVGFLNASGAATISWSFSTVGDHVITAAYGGPTNNPSTSLPVVQAVGTLVVNSSADTANPPPKTVTLRSAVITANGHAASGTADTIVFDITQMNGSAITLQNGALELTTGTAAVTIDGGPSGVTIAGAGTNLFHVHAGASLNLDSLTLSGGNAASNDQSAPFWGKYGGAVNNVGTLNVYACSFQSNTATGQGGAICNTGTMTVSASTFSGNQPGGANSGGAIDNDSGGTMTVSTSTFNSNQANTGGAIVNAGGATATLSADTIYGNTATTGGGVGTDGTLTMVDTIVAKNSASSGSDVEGAVTGNSTNNLIGDKTGLSGISDGQGGNQIGTSASPINPDLCPLGNYGGSTQTMPPLSGSPARWTSQGKAAGGPLTTLFGNISNQVAQFQVADAAAIASTANYTGSIQIGGEVIAATGVNTSSNMLTVVRSASAIGHNKGDGVYFAYDQLGDVIKPGSLAIGAVNQLGSIKLAPTTATEPAGQFFTISITVLDAAGNTCLNNNGTVTLTAGGQTLYGIKVQAGKTSKSVADSANPSITLQNGVATVSFNLHNAGTIALAAQQGSDQGSTSLSVTPLAPASITVTASVQTQQQGGSTISYNTAGLGFTLTVAAFDQYKNPTCAADLLAGTYNVTCNDGQVVGQAPFTDDTADPVPITALVILDTADSPVWLRFTASYKNATGGNASFSVGSNQFAVVGGVVDHFAVAAPKSVTVGVAFPLTVTPQDRWNNSTTNNGNGGQFQVALDTTTQNTCVWPSLLTFSQGGNFSVTVNFVGSASSSTKIASDPQATCVRYTDPINLKSASIPADFSKNVPLVDPGMQQLAYYYYNHMYMVNEHLTNHELNYNYMLWIYQGAEAEFSKLGEYDASGLPTSAGAIAMEKIISADLSTLASPGAGSYVHLPTYVQYLASQVAAPDPSELTFLPYYCDQDIALGVPVAYQNGTPVFGDGSSPGAGLFAQVTALVDQWFLGTILPNYYNGGKPTVYKTEPGDTFYGPTGAPLCTDIHQTLGDCGLLAPIEEVTYRDPGIIEGLFVNGAAGNGNGTYTIGLYDAPPTSNGREPAQMIYVTVDSEIADAAVGRPHGVLWPALLEKAFQMYENVAPDGRYYGFTHFSVGAVNSYDAVEALVAMTGQPAAGGSISASAIETALKAPEFVCVGTPDHPPPDSSDFLRNHEYAVLGYTASTDQLLFGNPWGCGPVCSLNGELKPDSGSKTVNISAFSANGASEVAPEGLAKNELLLIGSEVVKVLSFSNSSITVQRGIEGANTIADHKPGATVILLAWDNNNTKDCDTTSAANLPSSTITSGSDTYFNIINGGDNPGLFQDPSGIVTSGNFDGACWTTVPFTLPQAPSPAAAAHPAIQSPGPAAGKLPGATGHAPAAAKPATHVAPLAVGRSSADLTALDSLLAAWPTAKHGKDTDSGRNWNERAVSLLIQHKP